MSCFLSCEKRKIAAAKARAGREFPSPKTPFLPAPPERRFPAALRAAINFVQNRFGFGCINALIITKNDMPLGMLFLVTCL